MTVALLVRRLLCDSSVYMVVHYSRHPREDVLRYNIYIYTNIHICIITWGLTTPRRTSVKALAMVVPPLKEAWARHKMLAKRDPHYTRYEQDSTMSGANRHI